MILIENISNLIEFDRIHIEIEIVDSDSSLESELDRNRRSNSNRDFDLKTAIRFGTPNHISLLPSLHPLFPIPVRVHPISLAVDKVLLHSDESSCAGALVE